MQITFKNSPLKKSVKKRELRKAIKFFATELCHTNLIPYLSLEIQFMKFEPKYKNNLGFCDYEFPDYGNPREFKFELRRSMGRENMLKTVAHEMKHLEQYATGRLKDYVKDKTVVRWRGKKLKLNQARYEIDGDDGDYQFEIEACKAEEELYQKYMKYIKGK